MGFSCLAHFVITNWPHLHLDRCEVQVRYDMWRLILLPHNFWLQVFSVIMWPSSMPSGLWWPIASYEISLCERFLVNVLTSSSSKTLERRNIPQLILIFVIPKKSIIKRSNFKSKLCVSSTSKLTTCSD